MSLFNCMTKVFSPDLSSSSLVLPCWGWILWTKMWRFPGTIFWLSMLIPGKLSLKLQYNGWVWTGYREILCRQWNSQEWCKNNNNNYELEIGLLSCRLRKVWKENIKSEPDPRRQRYSCSRRMHRMPLKCTSGYFASISWNLFGLASFIMNYEIRFCRNKMPCLSIKQGEWLSKILSINKRQLRLCEKDGVSRATQILNPHWKPVAITKKGLMELIQTIFFPRCSENEIITFF